MMLFLCGVIELRLQSWSKLMVGNFYFGIKICAIMGWDNPHKKSFTQSIFWWWTIYSVPQLPSTYWKQPEYICQIHCACFQMQFITLLFFLFFSYMYVSHLGSHKIQHKIHSSKIIHPTNTKKEKVWSPRKFQNDQRKSLISFPLCNNSFDSSPRELSEFSSNKKYP
jgi:hypothetical protein